MTNDRIYLQGLAFYGYHGVLPEETRLGQRFLVDIELHVDTRTAGETDDLTHTVDYVAVYADIKGIVEGAPVRLIETVAERIAERVLGAYVVQAIRVRIRKPDVPIPAVLDHVAVEIFRTHAERGA